MRAELGQHGLRAVGTRKDDPQLALGDDVEAVADVAFLDKYLSIDERFELEAPRKLNDGVFVGIAKQICGP